MAGFQLQTCSWNRASFCSYCKKQKQKKTLTQRFCNFLNVISISIHWFCLCMCHLPWCFSQWMLCDDGCSSREGVCPCLCVCVCACACLCLSDPVFLSSLQSFSPHLVLIRTNSVEVSGWTAGLTLSPCALPSSTSPVIPCICIPCVSCRFSARAKH